MYLLMFFQIKIFIWEYTLSLSIMRIKTINNKLNIFIKCVIRYNITVVKYVLKKYLVKNKKNRISDSQIIMKKVTYLSTY